MAVTLVIQCWWVFVMAVLQIVVDPETVKWVNTELWSGMLAGPMYPRGGGMIDT
jgi:hypothetical protein